MLMMLLEFRLMLLLNELLRWMLLWLSEISESFRWKLMQHEKQERFFLLRANIVATLPKIPNSATTNTPTPKNQLVANLQKMPFYLFLMENGNMFTQILLNYFKTLTCNYNPFLFFTKFISYFSLWSFMW